MNCANLWNYSSDDPESCRYIEMIRASEYAVVCAVPSASELGSFLRCAAFAKAPVRQGQRRLQLLRFTVDNRLRKKLWRGKQPPLQSWCCETLVAGCRYCSGFACSGRRGVR